MIGITSIEITPEMVGRRVGVFTAIECKFGKNPPSTIQLKFLEMVSKYGGIATIARSTEDVQRAIKEYKNK